MYAIYRVDDSTFGNPTKRLTALGKFSSYEAARTAARKYIRRNATKLGYSPSWYGSNPAITDFSLTVKHVAF